MRRMALRAVLSLYPPALRDLHGPEIEHMVRVRLEEADPRGRRAVLTTWFRVLRDVLETRFRPPTVPGPTASRGPKERGMHQTLRDLRYALRRLARTPAFTVGALAIMAIAIGANTAVFAIVNQALLRPPPFDQPDRVVHVYQDSDDGEPSSTSFPAYRDMAALDGVFEAVSATTPTGATLELNDASESVAVEFTTASFLDVIGRTVTSGRWFDPSMDVVGAGNYAVVSHHAWRSRFGSDPTLVGRTLRLNGSPVTIIGIGPEGVNGVGGFIVTDLFLSISSVGVSGPFMISNLDRREDHWYDVKARLAEGVTPEQAQQAMDGLARSLAEQFPDLNRGRDITVFSSREVRVHPEQDGILVSVGAVLTAIVALVLILACTNLGGLLLVRGVSRGSEVAVRRALGAAPGRVARLFLSEAMLLTVGGGVLGLVVAGWLLRALAAAPLPGPLSGELDLSWDLRVVAFSLLLMIATGAFFGLAPALQSLRSDVAGILREDQAAPGRVRRLSLLRNGLVALQVAVSLILVVGAGVTVRNLAGYAEVDPGVDVEQLAFLTTNFSQAGIAGDERAPVVQQLRDAISAVPGVTDVALTSRVPVQGGGTTTTVVEGYVPASGTESVELDWALVGPDYFATVGIAVREGRGYTPGDAFGDERIVVVNEAAARTFWPGESAVDRRIRPQSRPDAWVRVIGVVADSKIRSLSERPLPILYYPMGPSGVGSPAVLVRTAGDPSAVLDGLRSALATVHPGLPVSRLTTMEGHLGEALAVPRMSAGVLGLFSALALALAAVGVYTIVSFSVAGRRREVGIRVALGAARPRVMWTVVSEVVWTVGFGLLIGTATVVLVSPRLQGLLFGSDILSVGTLLPALLILAGAVGVGSLIPALRAVRADPVEALRG